jgi:glycosyltransferase involved in cell wall biosynthesis
MNMCSCFGEKTLFCKTSMGPDMQAVTIAASRSSRNVVSGSSKSVELTILMPCLNEAETLATCIGRARAFLDSSGIVGEVLVADNGSTDGSQQIALVAGARLVTVPTRGYGAALITGITEAQGRYVIMGDADNSYDFSQLQSFVDALRSRQNDCDELHRYR